MTEIDAELKKCPERKAQPAVLFITFLFAPVFLAGFVMSTFYEPEWSFALVCMIFGILLIINWLWDRTYRIYADSQRIYMRDWSFRGLLGNHYEHSMTYDEISNLEGKFKGNAGAKSMFMPFEFLELTSSRPGAEDIWIYPPTFRDRDIKEFLFDLYARRPDIFPDYVLEYMRSDKPL